ncbi:hypothetical protein D3C73_1500290 [compost metagenome]
MRQPVGFFAGLQAGDQRVTYEPFLFGAMQRIRQQVLQLFKAIGDDAGGTPHGRCADTVGQIDLLVVSHQCEATACHF